MILIIIILQCICAILVAWGIVIEWTRQADWGFFLITAGSMLFALATKLFELKLLKDSRDNDKSLPDRQARY